MKRSEMVKLMYDFITNVESEHGYHMDQHDTDRLLAKMEEIGIRAPFNGVVTGHDLDSYDWEEE